MLISHVLTWKFFFCGLQVLRLKNYDRQSSGQRHKHKREQHLAEA